jgi:hypothetical protein
MFLTIPDGDQPASPNGPHFRVRVLLPEFVGRLIDRLVRFFNGGA